MSPKPGNPRPEPLACPQELSDFSLKASFLESKLFTVADVRE